MPSLSTRRPSATSTSSSKSVLAAPPAMLSGYLHKVKSRSTLLNKTFASTNKRFFVADARTERLLYYKKKDSKLPQGGVPLDDIEEVRRSATRADEFEVIGCSRQFILRADNAETALTWIEALQAHVDYTRTHGRASRRGRGAKAKASSRAASASPVDGATSSSVDIDDSASTCSSERPSSASASSPSASSPASSDAGSLSPEDARAAARWSARERRSDARRSDAATPSDSKSSKRGSRIRQPRAAAVPRGQGPSIQNGRITELNEAEVPETTGRSKKTRPPPSPLAMQAIARARRPPRSPAGTHPSWSTARATSAAQASSKLSDSPGGFTVERFVNTAVSPPTSSLRKSHGARGRRVAASKAATPDKHAQFGGELVLSDTESESDAGSWSPAQRAPSRHGFSSKEGDSHAFDEEDEEKPENDGAAEYLPPRSIVDGAASSSASTTIRTPAASRVRSHRAAGKEEATPEQQSRPASASSAAPAAGPGTPGFDRWDSPTEESSCGSPIAEASQPAALGFRPYAAHVASCRTPQKTVETKQEEESADFNSWDE